VQHKPGHEPVAKLIPQPLQMACVSSRRRGTCLYLNTDDIKVAQLYQ
jgi:hypothetical protein